MDTMSAKGARATFFVVGSNAAAQPDLLARMVAEGHAVGNHTEDHPDLSKLDAETVKGFIEQELGYFSVEALKNALKYSGKSEHARYTQLLRASQSRPPS